MNGPLGSVIDRLRPLGLAGGIAAGGAVLAALVCLRSLGEVALAAIAPGSVAQPPEAQQKQRLEKYEAAQSKRVAIIEGRSMFVAPVPPRAPEPADEEKKDDKPPPPPATYGGPGIVAIVYDRVWFDDGRSLATTDEDDAGLGVVDVSPPWAARLRWRGVEFDVTLFTRTTDDFLTKPTPEQPESK